MTDITMCVNEECPYQDDCWRLNCPPAKIRQAYQYFKFDYDEFEAGGDGCKFYISMDLLMRGEADGQREKKM